MVNKDYNNYNILNRGRHLSGGSCPPVGGRNVLPSIIVGQCR